MADNDQLEKIRAAMKKKKGGIRDPHEWRADKAEDKTLKWQFFILPPVETMTLWHYQHGHHFIDGKSHECPRIHDDLPCPLCQFGFDLIKKTDVKEKRSAIAKALLPQQRYAVNIYFPPFESTQVDLRGKVLWYSMPQTVYNICEEVIFRDGPGSGPEPEPHGIFFEPMKAYAFILEAKKKGDYNNYESSHFSNKKTPITSKGETKIQEILSMRHNIPTKFEARNIEALQAIVDRMSNGGSKEIGTKAAPAAKITTTASTTTATPPAPKVQSQSPVAPIEEELETEPSSKTEVEIEKVEAEKPVEASGIPESDPELDALIQELNK